MNKSSQVLAFAAFTLVSCGGRPVEDHGWLVGRYVSADPYSYEDAVDFVEFHEDGTFELGLMTCDSDGVNYSATWSGTGPDEAVLNFVDGGMSPWGDLAGARVVRGEECGQVSIRIEVDGAELPVQVHRGFCISSCETLQVVPCGEDSCAE